MTSRQELEIRGLGRIYETENEDILERLQVCLNALMNDKELWQEAWKEWFSLSITGHLSTAHEIPILIIKCYSESVDEGPSSLGCCHWPSHWHIVRGATHLLCNQAGRAVRIRFETKDADGNRIPAQVLEPVNRDGWVYTFPGAPKAVKAVLDPALRRVWSRMEWSVEPSDQSSWDSCGGSGNGPDMEMVGP